MTYETSVTTPSYVRRAPRWYDGLARLFDLGGTYRSPIAARSDEECLAEDFRLVQEDIERAYRATSGTRW